MTGESPPWRRYAGAGLEEVDHMLHFIDFEVFRFDWLCVIISPTYKMTTVIVNDKDALERYYRQYGDEVFVGYNIRNYDQWIMKGILCGFDPKEINDWIIMQHQNGYQFSSILRQVSLIIFDVMPNPPVGLKTLEGFMGNNIKETGVPFDIGRKLTDAEIQETAGYCTHDVEQTIEVFLHRRNEFDAMMGLVREFRLPLAYIGRTQAQLAAVILEARRQETDDEWDIRLPDTLRLGRYRHVADWFLDPGNHDEKKNLACDIAGVPHVFAWGGLHGAIAKYSYTCAPDELLIMADVDQLYPTLMIRYRLLSRAVKDYRKFEDILATSLRLKAEGRKKEREPYKRICNITYGAEGDKYNAMYDPLHRTLVCVFGQVLVLDLIEKLEPYCRLIQSNTDGILILIRRRDFGRIDDIVYDWEQRTGLHMGFDFYHKIMQKDVNNYVAVDYEVGYKSKGAYTKELSPIDNDLPIVNRAVVDYMVHGIPVERTIESCQELKQFQRMVKLSGKFDWVEHERLDGNVRYTYKSYRVFASRDDVDGKIVRCRKDGFRAKFGNTPQHCYICNENINGLEVPDRLDRKWYVDEARKRLEQYGCGEGMGT